MCREGGEICCHRKGGSDGITYQFLSLVVVWVDVSGAKLLAYAFGNSSKQEVCPLRIADAHGVFSPWMLDWREALASLKRVTVPTFVLCEYTTLGHDVESCSRS